MRSRPSVIVPIWSAASADVISMTGATLRSCFTTAGERSLVATTRSGASAATVSMLGSPRVPMSFGDPVSGAAVFHAV